MKIRCLFSIVAIMLWLPITIMAKDPVYKTESERDFQFRTGFEIEKKFSNGISLSWNEELRIKNDFGDLDRIYSGLGMGYKVAKWFKTDVSYTFISMYCKGKKSTNYEKYWDYKHRISLGLTFSYKLFNNWKFSLKERVQTTFLTEDNIDTREQKNPEWTLKSRLTAEYKIRTLPITPYTYIEVANTLNAPVLADGNYIEKVRTALGLEYQINKHNSIDFYYRFDYNFKKDIDVKKSTGELKSITKEKEYNHIVSISYKFQF